MICFVPPPHAAPPVSFAHYCNVRDLVCNSHQPGLESQERHPTHANMQIEIENEHANGHAHRMHMDMHLEMHMDMQIKFWRRGPRTECSRIFPISKLKWTCKWACASKCESKCTSRYKSSSGWVGWEPSVAQFCLHRNRNEHAKNGHAHQNASRNTHRGQIQIEMDIEMHIEMQIKRCI